jgi:hypothetical protein
MLTESDVREIAGFSSVVATDLDDVAVYENPDPRGPCGAPVDPMPTGVAGRAFTGADVTIVQLLHEDGAALAEYAEVLADDLRPGCGPHESFTNVGATQRVGEPSAVDTAGIGDSSVGWTTEITVEEHTAHAGLVFVVLGGRATAIQVMSTDVVTADAMVALAQGAATRLG